MESHARNNLFYLLRADTDDARQARRRLAVGSAFAVFLGGLLTAVGFAVVVLGVCLLIVALVGSVAAVRALRRNRDRLLRSVQSVAASAHRMLHRGAQGTGNSLRAVLHAGNAGVGHATGALSSVGHATAQTVTSRGQRLVSARSRHAARQEALLLNVAGTKHRRSGAHAEAIELHTRALELLSDADDLHAVALTQNNLALAMIHTGEDSEATSLFEQAAATVRELGDREQEGKIMANLALAHRRHGRSHECEETLRLALSKLHRDSTAYRRVEAELLRVA